MTKKSRRPLTRPSGWLKRFQTRKTTKRLEVSGSIEWRHALLFCQSPLRAPLSCSLSRRRTIPQPKGIVRIAIHGSDLLIRDRGQMTGYSEESVGSGHPPTVDVWLSG